MSPCSCFSVQISKLSFLRWCYGCKHDWHRTWWSSIMHSSIQFLFYREIMSLRWLLRLELIYSNWAFECLNHWRHQGHIHILSFSLPSPFQMHLCVLIFCSVLMDPGLAYLRNLMTSSQRHKFIFSNADDLKILSVFLELYTEMFPSSSKCHTHFYREIHAYYMTLPLNIHIYSVSTCFNTHSWKYFRPSTASLWRMLYNKCVEQNAVWVSFEFEQCTFQKKNKNLVLDKNTFVLPSELDA